MAARKVTGARRCDRITPILEDLHWLAVSQRVISKTALMVWKCVHGVVPAYLSDLRIPATATSGRENLRSASSRTLLVPRVGTSLGQRSFAVDRPTTWNTRAVTERLHTCTEDAPVLDCPAPLRRLLRDSSVDALTD